MRSPPLLDCEDDILVCLVVLKRAGVLGKRFELLKLRLSWGAARFGLAEDASIQNRIGVGVGAAIRGDCHRLLFQLGTIRTRRVNKNRLVTEGKSKTQVKYRNKHNGENKQRPQKKRRKKKQREKKRQKN
jgi:hypothetical protein